MTTGEIGKRINERYEITGRVGAGGMGTVWSGTDISLNRQVAIKEVTIPRGLSSADAEQLRARYLREGRAAARLHHPGVVGVYDVISEEADPNDPHSPDGGRVWIVMELLAAKDLSQIIRENGRLDPVTVAQLGLQLLEALDAAHNARVLHRDVKPANVLLCEPDERAHSVGERRAVLTDFGIASIMGDPSLTRTGQLLGSPAYVPPERLSGKHELGPASDLWSLGCTLYAAVEGRAPFHHDDPMKIITAITLDPVPEPRYAGPLSPVLMGLLIKDPQQRWDASRTRDALRHIIEGRALAPGSAPVTPPAEQTRVETLTAITEAPPSKPGKALKVVAIAAIALVVLGALVLAGTQFLDKSDSQTKKVDQPRRQVASTKRFIHPMILYVLYHPANWDDSCSGDICTFGPDLSDDSQAKVKVTKLTGTGSPQTQHQIAHQTYQTQRPQYRVQENSPRITIGRNGGAKLDYTYRGKTEVTRTIEFRTQSKNGQIHLIALTGPAAAVGKELTGFNKIAGSFYVNLSINASPTQQPSQPIAGTTSASPSGRSEPSRSPSAEVSVELSRPSRELSASPSKNTSAPSSSAEPSATPAAQEVSSSAKPS